MGLQKFWRRRRGGREGREEEGVEEAMRGARVALANSDDSIRQVRLATLKGAIISGFKIDFNRFGQSSLSESRS